MFTSKRLFFLTALFLVVGIAFFPREIFLACVKFQTNRSCKRLLNTPLKNAAYSWENGTIVCRNGELENIGRFSEARFKPAWSWKKREIGGSLEIDHLEMFDLSFLRKKARKARSFKLFSFKPKAHVKGNLMGMEGELILDWEASDCVMQIDFAGSAHKIVSLFFKEAFEKDHFALKAKMHPSTEGLDLEGSLVITGLEEYHLLFGCAFRNECRFGWFHGEGFPLEKFLNPFLLADVHMEAVGRVNFLGTFDERYIVVNYEGEKLGLESPHFSLQAATGAGCHTFDLQRGGHVGYLPLHQGTYYQKNRDLCFTEAAGTVHFNNNTITLLDTQAKWNQLTLKGEIEIEIRALEDVDLKIKAEELSGPVSDAQALLSHFSNSLFWEIPFQGEVASKGDVFLFHYHFSPSAELVAGYLQGDFCGALETPHIPCSVHITYDLKDLEIDFVSPLCSFHSSIGTKILLKGDEIALEANRLDNAIEITHFLYKEWEGEGEIEWTDEEIHVKKMSVRAPKGDAALSGSYLREVKEFHGAIENLHWRFERTASPWKPSGEILGMGTVRWDLSQGTRAFLNASFQDLEFGGIHFGSGKDLVCTYSSQEGLSVEGLEAEISNEKYKLGRFFYDLKKPRILFQGFDFSLPPEKLPCVAKMANTLFPGKVYPACIEWVETIKQNEPLEGRISLEVYPDHIWVALSLKEGAYYLSGKKWNLKNFTLIYDPIELGIWTQGFFCDKEYWAYLQADSMTLSHGKLAISERPLSPHAPPGSDALVTRWERQSDKGFFVRSVKGDFHGMQVALEAASKAMDISEEIELIGRVGIDLSKTRSLFKGEIGKIVDRFSLGGGYALDGTFTFPKSNPSQLRFSGSCTGEGFHLAGIELASLSARLDYHPDNITFSNVSVKDWAGRLSIKQANFVRKEHTWSCACDKIELEDLRLSRLKSPWTQKGSKAFFRTFFIRSFYLNDFEADLSDMKSFGGEGTFEFSNIPKRTFLSNLLFIPSEITARIGLDFTSFIPVRGIIDYEIRDGKVYLNAFRDMYSDGKHSRFYLAEGTNAYIDFAGNLNMKLKMKQYNLLMKLAEFFTITVKGTLVHPTYTLSNQVEEE